MLSTKFFSTIQHAFKEIKRDLLRLRSRLPIQFVIQHPYLNMRRERKRMYFIVMIKIILDTVGLLL